MEAKWKKSTRSEGANNCVEVRLGETVGVRDTKRPDAGQLNLSRESWAVFTAAITR
jgi:hypothetical protein